MLTSLRNNIVFVSIFTVVYTVVFVGAIKLYSHFSYVDSLEADLKVSSGKIEVIEAKGAQSVSEINRLDKELHKVYVKYNTEENLSEEEFELNTSVGKHIIVY